MTNPRKHERNLLSDERGSAMVEAAIMLPVFILIFGSVMYMSKKYETAVRMQERARHCAWLRAKSACEADAPAGCNLSEGVDVSESQFGEATQQSGANSSDIQSADDDRDFGDKLMDLIAGSAVTAEQHADVRRPNVLGGASIGVHGRLGLSCNEKIKDNLGEVIEAAWNSLADF